MCTAIDEMRKESRNEGRQEGKDEGILSSLKNLMANMNLTLQQAMDALGIPAAEKILVICEAFSVRSKYVNTN